MTGEGFDAYVGASVELTAYPTQNCPGGSTTTTVGPDGTFKALVQSNSVSFLGGVLTLGTASCKWMKGVVLANVTVTPADFVCSMGSGGAAGAAGSAGAGGQ